MLKEICAIGPASSQLLKNAMERLNLSARAYDRIQKLSRTLADLSASTEIQSEHLAEAIHSRTLDREGWAGWALALAVLNIEIAAILASPPIAAKRSRGMLKTFSIVAASC